MRAPGRPRARLPLLPSLLAVALSSVLAGGGAAAPPGEKGWVELEATWTATGRRHTLRAGSREAAIFRLSGAFVVSRGDGLRKGFRAEAIAYDAGAGSGLGTMVLTDDRGDQVFCDLVGSTSGKGRVIVGTVTGGSGSYAGIEGTFSFRWEHLVVTEGDEVQGIAVGLTGRYRRPPAGSAPPGPEAPR